MGFVEKLEHVEVDLYLLFSSRRRKTPFAAVIYGKEKPFAKKKKARWVDKIFPPSVRGQAQEDFYSSDQWFQRGYVSYNKSNVIIGYRSDKAWNPKQFL